MSGLGLYVHFPWCVRKCPYCDFNSHPLKGSLDERGYLEALERDLDAGLQDVGTAEVATVFFGGGTPSLFSPESFARLLDKLAPKLAPAVEVTLEANPGTTEHHNLAGYRAAGVNRLSLGAQSFSDAQLRRLGRIHAAREIERSVERARGAGFDNVNLDIMYGLPTQGVAEALADLERAVRLAPEHLSWYQLTLEPKTEFGRRPPRLPSDGVIATMEREGRVRLADAGYARYEVSAYARSGRVCRHNLNYWTFGDYVGAGAGAHGKRTRSGTVWRTAKPRQPRLYLADPLAVDTVAVAAAELTFEFMMNALRLEHGVDRALFTERTGLPWARVAPVWEVLAADGLVDAERVATTARGYRYLDSVLQRFLT